MESEKKCCICGKKFYGWGNNAWPVDEDGTCCDDCNYMIVIPARLVRHHEIEKEKKLNGNV